MQDHINRFVHAKVRFQQPLDILTPDYGKADTGSSGCIEEWADNLGPRTITSLTHSQAQPGAAVLYLS